MDLLIATIDSPQKIYSYIVRTPLTLPIFRGIKPYPIIPILITN